MKSDLVAFAIIVLIYTVALPLAAYGVRGLLDVKHKR